MLRKNFLVYFLIFLIGILLGILFFKYTVPNLELFLVSKRKIEVPQTLPSGEKKTELFCQKLKEGIEVSLTEQKLRLCENGKAREEFTVSTGKKETPTPTGEFTVIKKSPMIYSKLAESWLPFWVGFYQDYGFHELPITETGERIGETEIGKPGSLGCVRLKVGESEKLYQFAQIGMKVLIYGETPD